MKIVLFLVATLSILQLNAKSQPRSEWSIRGTVVDEESKPLSFASVLLRHSADSTIIRSTFSNDSGAFVFEQLKPASYFIEIKMLGYATYIKRDISIDEDVSEIRLETVQLKPSSKMLSEVTVKADVPFIERRADKIIVNLNEGLTAGGSIMEVMNKLPGVSVSIQDQISLNGKSVTVYIDGRITSLQGEALASYLKGVSSSNIEKVELITNPSSKYDAAGGGGIINIVRKRNTKEGLIGSLYSGYQKGRYGRHGSGITLNLKNKRYNSFFNTNYAYSKYFIDSQSFYRSFSADQTFTGQSQFNTMSTRDNTVVTPSIGFDFYISQKTTLSVSTSQSLTRYNKLASTLVVNSSANTSPQERLDLSNNVGLRSGTNISNIHLQHKIDSMGKEITADVDYSGYDNNSDLNNSDRIYDASGNYLSDRNNELDQDGEINMYALKVDYTNPINKLTNLEFGFKSGYTKSDNSNLFYILASGLKRPDDSKTDHFNYAENISALYVNFNKKYNKLSFQAGLRGEHTFGKGLQLQTRQNFTNQYLKLFPSVSFDYKLTSKHGLTLNLNKRITRPNYESLNPLVKIVNSSTFTRGNPLLLPVISYNSSLSYSFRNELFFNLHYDVGLREIITVTSGSPDAPAFTSRPENNRYSNYLRAYLIYSKRIKSWWMSSNSIQVFQQGYKSIVNGYELNSRGTPASEISSYQEFDTGKRLSLMFFLRYQSKFEARNLITEENYYSSAGFKFKIFGDKGSLSVHMTDIFETFRNRYTENSIVINQVWNNSYETRILFTNLTYNFGKGRVKNVTKGTASDDERKRTSLKEN